VRIPFFPLRVFISYAGEQYAEAEELAHRLRAAGYRAFLDRHDLEEGRAFDERIRERIGRSDLFIFLVSPQSVQDGSYARSELKFAAERWPAPGGRVLGVEVAPTDFSRLPRYLGTVTVLRPEGNAVAETLAHVADHRRKLRRRDWVAAAAAVALLAAAAVFLPRVLAPPADDARAAVLSPADALVEEAGLYLAAPERMRRLEAGPRLSVDEITGRLAGRGVSQAGTPNRGQDIRPQMIVFHGTVNTAYGPETTAVFGDPQRNASVHVIVARDGGITQLVSFDSAAFHARGFNDRSVGVELVNYGPLKREGDAFRARWDTSAVIDPGQVVTVFADGGGEPAYFHRFSDEQVDRVVHIVRALRARYGSLTLAGHDRLDSRRQEPGPAFPLGLVEALAERQDPYQAALPLLQQARALDPGHRRARAMRETILAWYLEAGGGALERGDGARARECVRMAGLVAPDDRRVAGLRRRLPPAAGAPRAREAPGCSPLDPAPAGDGA
jgi:N-acetylmuramoyl-L-alanine amidase